MNSAAMVDASINDLRNRGASKPYVVKSVAKSCLEWSYVYAAAGCMCTPENRRHYADICKTRGLTKYYDMIINDCPILSKSYGASCETCKYHDTRCFDCRGFTQWVLAQADIPLFGGGATTQYDTKSNWVIRGTIDKMPKDLICCLFKKDGDRMSHTGLWLTGDLIIHCSGIVKEDHLPGNRPWTHFGLPVGLYSTEYLRAHGITVDESKNIPTLRKGSTGANVRLLQNLLNAAGAKLNVDGIFGKDTEGIVKWFQQAHHLTADGIVGPKTWAALRVYEKTACDEQESDDVDISRSREAWDQLYARLQNPYSVAGILGNLEAESGINPINLESKGNTFYGMTDVVYTENLESGKFTKDQFKSDGFGYGIAQWTHSTRKAELWDYAHSLDAPIGTLPLQISFLLKELDRYSILMETLKHAQTVKEASDAFMLQFEKPKNQSEENLQRRASLGQSFFDLYHDIPADESEGDEQNEETVKEYYVVPKEDIQRLKDAAQFILDHLKTYQ